MSESSLLTQRNAVILARARNRILREIVLQLDHASRVDADLAGLLSQCTPAVASVVRERCDEARDALAIALADWLEG